jgi:hypothetical protein
MHGEKVRGIMRAIVDERWREASKDDAELRICLVSSRAGDASEAQYFVSAKKIGPACSVGWTPICRLGGEDRLSLLAWFLIVPRNDLTDADEHSRGLNAVYVDLPLFQRGVRTILALIEARSLRLLVGGSVRRFQFELHEDSAEEALSSHEISRLDLGRVFFDLEDVLVANTSGADREHFIRRRSDSKRFPDGEAEDPSVAGAKFDLVSRSFDIDGLARRVWIKSSAKTNVSRRFDWEVLIKCADSQAERPVGGKMVTATLRVASEPPDLDVPIRLTHQEVVMTVDTEDIDYMIDSLKRLKEAIEQADTGGGR